MCCRYYFGEETSEFIRKILGQSEKAASFPTGDIRPSDRAPILVGTTEGFAAEEMRWGFPSPVSKQLMINARAETVFEKKSFAESVRMRRCIVVADRFYEWDKQKNMVTFTVPGRNVICMAGIYRLFDEDFRFTVITTAANASMLPVHDRMPVVLGEDVLHDWLTDGHAAREILKSEHPVLERHQDYEQLTLLAFL